MGSEILKVNIPSVEWRQLARNRPMQGLDGFFNPKMDGDNAEMEMRERQVDFYGQDVTDFVIARAQDGVEQRLRTGVLRDATEQARATERAQRKLTGSLTAVARAR